MRILLSIYYLKIHVPRITILYNNQKLKKCNYPDCYMNAINNKGFQVAMQFISVLLQEYYK